LRHPEFDQVRYGAIARIAITCAERDLALVLAGRHDRPEHYWRGLAAIRSACGKSLAIAVRMFEWAYDSTLTARERDRWRDAGIATSPVPADLSSDPRAKDSSSAIGRWKRSMLLPRVCGRCKTPIVAIEVSLGNGMTVWRCPACHAELDGLVE
jgi:hypothetical protein